MRQAHATMRADARHSGFSLRHGLERGARRPGSRRTSHPPGISRHRYGQPAETLFRGRSGRRARRRLSRGHCRRATIYSCKPNSLISADRTIACHTIPQPPLAAQVAQSLASSLEHLGTDTSTASCCTGRRRTTNGPATTPKYGRRCEKSAMPARHADARRQQRNRCEHLEQMKSGGTESACSSCRTDASRAMDGTAKCANFAISTTSSTRDSRCSPRIAKCWRHPPC